jgi:hypothetical protein
MRRGGRVTLERKASGDRHESISRNVRSVLSDNMSDRSYAPRYSHRSRRPQRKLPTAAHLEVFGGRRKRHAGVRAYRRKGGTPFGYSQDAKLTGPAFAALRHALAYVWENHTTGRDVNLAKWGLALSIHSALRFPHSAFSAYLFQLLQCRPSLRAN